jgi:TIR domain
MAEGAAAFWSYTRADDEGDHGRVQSLAQQLVSQFRLATGGDVLDLFMDRTDIRWGDEWKARIEGAIAGTTFFIPVITPSYFRSQACRDELFQFAREAEKAGLERLLMPIYWRTVPDLEEAPEESPDAAIRLVHHANYEDLRSARLEDEESAVFRKAVDTLAEELVRRATEAERVDDRPPEPRRGPPSGEVVVAGVELDRDENVDQSDDGEEAPGMLDRLVAGEDALAEIMVTTEAIGEALERVGAIAQSANAEIVAAAAKGSGGARAVLTATERFAQQLDDPAKALERLGNDYSMKLADLDDGVKAQLELWFPGGDTLTPEQREELKSFEGVAAISDQMADQLDEFLSIVEPMTSMSRSLRVPLRRMRKGLQGITDGRSTIRHWADGAAELLEGEASESIED